MRRIQRQWPAAQTWAARASKARCTRLPTTVLSSALLLGVPPLLLLLLLLLLL